MNHSGNITLLVDGKVIQTVRYESVKERANIIHGWKLLIVVEYAACELSDMSYTIAPDEYVPDPEIVNVMPQYTWDFQPYKPPQFAQEEWKRPPAVYSNKQF
jgi:hypothetical protein